MPPEILIYIQCVPRSVGGDPTDPTGWTFPKSAYLLLGSALLPLHVHDLSKLEISRVSSQNTSGAGVTASQADLRVDVEHAAGTAWRPDNGCAVSLVVLEVVAVGWPVELVLSRGLFRVSAYLVHAPGT